MQTFRIDITLKTECEDLVNEPFVKAWVENQFEGSDVGEVTVDVVKEIPDMSPSRDLDGTAQWCSTCEKPSYVDKYVGYETYRLRCGHHYKAGGA